MGDIILKITVGTATTVLASAKSYSDDKVTAEATARQNADSSLQQAINNEATARQNADSSLQQAINNEATARQNAIAAAIAGLINSAPGALDTLKELADALGDDPNFATTVLNAIANEATARVNSDNTLSNRITNEISAEVTARNAAITTAINNLINGAPQALDTLKELADELANDDNAIAALVTSIANEVTNRQQAISNLQQTIELGLDTEATDRQNNDNDIRANTLTLCPIIVQAINMELPAPGGDYYSIWNNGIIYVSDGNVWSSVMNFTNGVLKVQPSGEDTVIPKLYFVSDESAQGLMAVPIGVVNPSAGIDEATLLKINQSYSLAKQLCVTDDNGNIVTDENGEVVIPG